MTIFVHVTNGPIGQQTIINHTVRNFVAISIRFFYFQIRLIRSIYFAKYLNENARHVNFPDLMHSISHSPTDRTVNESRTIDLKNRLVSIAWKKHSKNDKIC